MDESHHSAAKVWTEVIKKSKCPVLGLTATPCRTSKTEGFTHIFDELIIGPSITELIEQGYLVNPEIYSPSYGAIEGIGKTISDYSMPQTWKYSKNSALLVELGIEWLSKFKDRKTIIYTVGKQHAHSVYREAQKRGFSAGIILSTGISKDNNPSIREETFKKFVDGEYNVLINCEILTEGVDIPECDTILKLRPTLSLILDMQMSGRVMRPYPDGREKDAIILDAAHNFTRHGLPTEPKTWKLEPETEDITKGIAPYKICPNCRLVCAVATRMCSTCKYSFGTVCNICGSFNTSKICTRCSIESQKQIFAKSILQNHIRPTKKSIYQGSPSTRIANRIAKLSNQPKSILSTNGNIDIQKLRNLYNQKISLYSNLRK